MHYDKPAGQEPQENGFGWRMCEGLCHAQEAYGTGMLHGAIHGDSRELIGESATEEDALVHEKCVQDAALRAHLDAPVQHLWLAVAGRPQIGDRICPKPASHGPD